MTTFETLFSTPQDYTRFTTMQSENLILSVHTDKVDGSKKLTVEVSGPLAKIKRLWAEFLAKCYGNNDYNPYADKKISLFMINQKGTIATQSTETQSRLETLAHQASSREASTVFGEEETPTENQPLRPTTLDLKKRQKLLATIKGLPKNVKPSTIQSKPSALSDRPLPFSTV